MLKQSPSRNQRPKGFKVKHVLHICALLAVCIWLLYQIKHSHDKKAAAYEDISLEISRRIQNGRDEIIKLGRRDLHPLTKDTSFDNKKLEEKEEEIEDSKPEEGDQEDGRGGGDDEIDGHDQERAEEEETEGVEDFIDEEDRERDEGSEEEDKGLDFKDVNLLEDQTRYEKEGKRNIQEAREEHHKEDDDASGSVMQNIQTISGSLRKVQEKEVESENEFEVGKETETYHTQDLIAGMKDSETTVHQNLRAKGFGSENAKGVEEISNELASARSDVALYLNSLDKAEENEQSKVNHDSAMLLVKGTTSLGGTSQLRGLIHDPYPTCNGRESCLQTHANLTTSALDNSDAVQKVMEVLNGSRSISSQGTLQFDETEKSTNEKAVHSGESETNSGLHGGEKSSKDIDNR